MMSSANDPLLALASILDQALEMADRIPLHRIAITIDVARSQLREEVDRRSGG